MLLTALFTVKMVLMPAILLGLPCDVGFLLHIDQRLAAAFRHINSKAQFNIIRILPALLIGLDLFIDTAQSGAYLVLISIVEQKIENISHVSGHRLIISQILL